MPEVGNFMVTMSKVANGGVVFELPHRDDPVSSSPTIRSEGSAWNLKFGRNCLNKVSSLS